jgi:rhodanese-related sulfurtransferase
LPGSSLNICVYKNEDEMKKILLIRLFIKVISITTFLAFFIICIVNCKQEKESNVLISTEKVNEIVSDSSKIQDYLILDLRSRMDYIRGHLVSSIWMNSDSLKAKLDMLPKNRKIILYDADEIESLKTAIVLRKNGFTNFYVMQGGFTKWIKNSYPAAIQLVMNTSNKLSIEKKDITAEEMHNILTSGNEEYTVIDIRSLIAFREQHIKDALSIPYVPINEFVVGIEERNFSRNRPLILYADNSSDDIGVKAADVLLRNNYTEVYLLKGGIKDWIDKSYSVE